MPEPVCLFVAVPVCAFRPFASREYQDTYPVPTPASVYGMLLSYLGVKREEKWQHRGAELALAVERVPPRSKVFRKLRRGADLEKMRPDYQDILTDLALWVWVRQGADLANPCLADRLRKAVASPNTITREGGLSLGESSYLVDTVALKQPPSQLHFVIPDHTGFYSLPTWVDHVDSTQTVTRRCRISESSMPVDETLAQSWFNLG